MATTGYSSSNYHSIADHADLTHPNGDWSEILIVKTGTVSGTKVIISNGASYAANTRQLFVFDDSLELVVNGTDGTLVSNLSADTWYLIVLHRSSGNMQVKYCEMGSTSVQSGGLVSLSASSDSSGATYIGRNNDATASVFDGAVSDWLFIPGVSISNSDMQDIATGTAIDSFSWYGDVDVWAILEDSTNTDYIGGKTITENGTLSSETDPVDLVRFGGITVDGAIATSSSAGAQGLTLLGSTIDGNVATSSSEGITGLALLSTIINGAIATSQSVGITGSIAGNVVLNGSVATSQSVGISGEVILLQTIDGNIATSSSQGIAGDVQIIIVIDGNIATSASQGISGQVFATDLILGNVATSRSIGVSGYVRFVEVPVTIGGSNIFFIGKNLLDDATLTATSTASGFDVDNMKIDKRSSIWRSTDLSEQTITVTWAAGQQLSGIGLAFTNLIDGSTVQIKLYTNSGDPSPVYDSGVKNIEFNYDPPTGFSSIGLDSFAFGGGNYFATLLDTTTAEEMEVIVNSSGNPDGYMEISRIITGFAFTPAYGAEYGASIDHDDSTVLFRTDSGDSLSHRGTINKRMSLNLGVLRPVDRQALMNIIRSRGVANPIFASIYENSDNAEEKQSYMIYGRFDALPSTRIYSKDFHDANITITEI